MDCKQNTWMEWRRFFENRKNRALPALQSDIDYSNIPASVAKSLAIFQLGESGGGTVIAQARETRLDGVDQDYADAVELFVEEEHRHANILALSVRLLGGTLIRKNWTAKLFVTTRRLMGLRFKVLVLLAAEVVGICYFHLLASRLPECHIRNWLLELVMDERAHLHFHCQFIRQQIRCRWHERLFVAAWRSVMFAAAIAVLLDHWRAIRDLRLDTGSVINRWSALGKLAETLIIGGDVKVQPERVDETMPLENELGYS